MTDWSPVTTGESAPTETVHTMEDSDHAFRLVVWREPVTELTLP
jgi:hypothetical protein